MTARHQVVVIGGGFAGVEVALGLKDAACDVTLVDRRNFHLFQPLLYQVATGGLSPGDITAPLRTIVRGCKNVRTVLAEVDAIDVAGRRVLLRGAEPLPYDTIAVATGVRHSYFGHDDWERHAPGLKSIEDATEIRARVLAAFEQAERATTAEERAAWLRFVVVGGGPTGVELAGALGELAQHTMRGEFRAFDSRDARVVLIETGPKILSMYVDRLGERAIHDLEALGVAVWRNTNVEGVDDGGVDVVGPHGRERVPCRTVLWAAGTAASPLVKALASSTTAKQDRVGRIVVEPDLTVAGHPEILVLGDACHFAHTRAGQPLPGVATVAMQMGRHAAQLVRLRIESPERVKTAGDGPAFAYLDKGTMAVIGRNKAVARVGFGLDLSFTGFFAWLAWLFVHIAYLVGFENRALVLLQWANHYVTRHRGARLITEARRVGD
ncbi:MAG: NAD(P)/FAD-dependent oxidoreductase [Deltaproteobacteria bacterium]|nr:NAD(P)/FAD-dependent oxidoreductase [Deltaproteobacteria bacterium]